MDKISVIVPIYKVEKYLPQCLDSIIRQTYRNLEIILIDDGSPDGCGTICDEYARNDDRIVVIHKKNGGLSAARNDGIARATGDWVTFVDSDDWCELDYYERMLESTGGEEADLVFAGGYYMDYPDKCNVVHTFTKAFVAEEKDSLEMLTIRTLLPGRSGGARFGYPWDKLYRRSFIADHQLTFDLSQKAWEDCCFNFKFFNEANRIVCGDAVGYHYRQTSDSITRGYDPKKAEIMYDVISTMNTYADQHGLEGRLLLAIKEAAIPAMAAALSSYFSPANTKPHTEVYKELKEMINWPFFHQAVCEPSNEYLTVRQVMLKYALRTGSGGGTSYAVYSKGKPQTVEFGTDALNMPRCAHR